MFTYVVVRHCTTLDVESFWNQVKETREIKYGKDSSWDKNMNYCSCFSEKIALSKGNIPASKSPNLNLNGPLSEYTSLLGLNSMAESNLNNASLGKIKFF